MIPYKEIIVLASYDLFMSGVLAFCVGVIF